MPSAKGNYDLTHISPVHPFLLSPLVALIKEKPRTGAVEVALVLLGSCILVVLVMLIKILGDLI